MRTLAVVVGSPVFQKHVDLSETSKHFPVQKLVTQFAIHAFDEAVLPGTARLDILDPGACLLQPLPQGFGDKFRAVVAAQKSRTPYRTRARPSTSITCAEL